MEGMKPNFREEKWCSLFDYLDHSFQNIFYFICELIIELQHVSLPSPCSTTCQSPSLLPFKSMASAVTNCTCIYITFSSYAVTCRYVFRADHLALDSQLVCSSQGRAISPFAAALSYFQ